MNVVSVNLGMNVSVKETFTPKLTDTTFMYSNTRVAEGLKLYIK